MEQQEQAKRRHSVDTSETPHYGRRVSFCGIDDKNQVKPQSRRHSMMILPQGHQMEHGQYRRNSRRFSIQPLHELSLTTFSGLPMQNKPAVLIENTYQLEPDPETRFKTHLVHDETKKAMERVLSESNYMIQPIQKYDKAGSRFKHLQRENPGGDLAKKLVTQVKDELKKLNMERYKLVVNAFVGDNCGQGLVIASRSIWNTDTDNHVTVVEKNANKYAVVVVHGVYYE